MARYTRRYRRSRSRRSPYRRTRYVRRPTYRRRRLYKRGTKQRSVIVRKFKIGMNVALIADANTDHTAVGYKEGTSYGIINPLDALSNDATFMSMLGDYDEFRVGTCTASMITQILKYPTAILESLAAVDRNSFQGRQSGFKIDPAILRSYESVKVRHVPGDQRLRFGNSISPVGYAENNSYIATDAYSDLVAEGFVVSAANRSTIPYNPSFLFQVVNCSAPFNSTNTVTISGFVELTVTVAFRGFRKVAENL